MAVQPTSEPEIEVTSEPALELRKASTTSEGASWYAYVLVSFSRSAAANSPTTKRRKRAPLADPQRLAAKVVRTYVGVALDVERRARQHNGEIPGGARSTRVGRPWRVAVVHGPFPDRGSAQSVEHQLKKRRGAAARLRPL